MDFILIAGLWLRHTVWAQVTTELERLGHRAVALPLAGATLDDQIAAVVAAVDAAVEAGARPVVVGHSAASTLAWIAADRRPSAIERVVMVGGFPSASGAAYADFFDVVDGEMPFPGWEPFDGPDSADLDEAARAQLVTDMVAVPEAVARGVVELHDERRFDVPVVLVCPEYTPEQAQEWIAGGDLPELEHARHVTFANIDSGHWPMVTRPTELARLLDISNDPG